MAFLKINGFHTGVTGNPSGIGDFLKRVDRAGVPFLAYCQEGTTSLIDAQQIIKSSNIDHNAIFRRVRFPENQGGYDVPDYNSEPAVAARKQWISHKDRFPPELDPEIIWSETVNELRKEVEWADWIGEFCYETAVLALADGFKWAGPGYSTGTPDEGSWETAGMLKFLRLAASNRDRIAVALHEYSLVPDNIWYQRGFHIGRFRFLNEACRVHGIDPPTIFFTEWGWAERDLPGPNEAIKQIIEVGELYARYPNVKGAAIWALDGGWGNLHNKTNKLIEPLAKALETVRFPDPDVEPDPDPERDYVVVVNLVPQTYSVEEVEKVVEETWEKKQTICASADDAGWLAAGGKEGSLVRIWDPQRWEDDIVSWLIDRFDIDVEMIRTEPDPKPDPEFKIPQRRDLMPLIVDVSKWQDRNRNGIADDLDFLRMRDEGGVRGVIIRASDLNNADPLYDDWLAVVQRANLPHGNYHRLSKFSPAAYQFERFMQIRVPGQLGDWLDVEKFGEDIPTADQVLEFEALYFAATGKQIGIYTNYQTWKFYIQLTDEIRPLWLANYESEPGALNAPVAVPKPWLREDWGKSNRYIKYWQYGAYTIPGSDSPIDCNVFHGSEEEFAYLYPQRPNPPKGAARVGLHASADGGTIFNAELEEFRQLQPGVIKVLSSTGAESIAALANDFPRIPFIIRAFLDFGGRNVSPYEFVDWTLPDVMRTIGKLRSGNDVWIELHNEPNLRAEGWGSSWANGKEFNDWFRGVMAIYRSEIPGAKYLFPGLSPGSAVNEIKLDSWVFLQDCREAIELADGLAVHAYWSKDWPMDRTFAQLKPIVDQFGDQPIWITECSNNKSGTSPDKKAEEYAQFIKRIRADLPEIQGATFFVASASNQAWNWSTGTGETWVGVDMGIKVRENLVLNMI